MELLYDTWPWYVAGPSIALIMFLLIFMGKRFGMSSNLETMCAACGAGKSVEYFSFDWRKNRWNLVVILGAAIGGFIGAHFLNPDKTVPIDNQTVIALKDLGFQNPGQSYLPDRLFSMEALADPYSLFLLLLGGLLVGFGARYAGGCTSGHAISGLSNLQLPSLVAVTGFFIGGLVMIHFIFPIIF